MLTFIIRTDFNKLIFQYSSKSSQQKYLKDLSLQFIIFLHYTNQFYFYKLTSVNFYNATDSPLSPFYISVLNWKKTPMMIHFQFSGKGHQICIQHFLVFLKGLITDPPPYFTGDMTCFSTIPSLCFVINPRLIFYKINLIKG